MSAKKFKFVSPGIFLNEVDQSVLPRLPQAIGPAIIGRTKRGPAFRPTRIDSFSDFLEVFGEPVPGGGSDGDQWRDGVPQGPTYASYAAQAYLRNNGPVTMVRVLGSEHPSKEAGGEAGYVVGAAGSTAGLNQTTGGAFGFFVFPSASAATNITGTLGAIFYMNNGSIELSGTVRGAGATEDPRSAASNASGTCVAIKNDANGNFRALIKSSTDTAASIGDSFVFNFNPDDDKYIRKVFNTNPTLTNSDVTVANSQKNYFLGQSYDRKVQEVLDKSPDGTTGRLFGVVLPLKDATNSGNEYLMAARAAQSGWVISQDLRQTAGNLTESSANAISFDPEGNNVAQLFKFHSLSEGEWEQRNLKISIERIVAPRDNFNKYGSFSVVLRKMEDNDKAQKIVERFDSLNLNPNSPDFIAKRIGDMYEVWDDTRRRLQSYGSFENMSKFIRVELANDVETGQADPELIPFGFFGPVAYNDFSLSTSDNFGVGSAATLTDAITIASGDADTDTITITMPSGLGSDGGKTIEIKVTNLMGATPTANQINVTMAGGSTTGIASAIINAINGVNDAATVKYGSNISGGTSTGINGLTAAAGSTASKITLTASSVGTVGNSVTLAETLTAGSVNSPLAGGNDNEATDFNGAVISGSAFARASLETTNAPETYTSFSTGSFVQVSPLSGSGLTTGNDSNASNNFIPIALDCKLEFPSHRLVENSSEFGLADHRTIYFGIDTTKSGSQQLAFDHSNIDIAYPLSKDVAASFAPDSVSTTSYVFTLDDVSGSSVNSDASAGVYDRFYYISGSRASGNSITAASGSYKSLLNAFEDVGGARFTMPLFGGFDGFDVTEKEPFNHRASTGLLRAGVNERNSSGYYSIKKGIDIVADPEFVEMNLAAIPGIVNENLTKHLIDVCEERADALAIIDPLGGYTPNTEDTTSEQSRTSTTAAKTVSDNMKARNINSSYGAAYFPWVQIRDSIRGNLLYVPPSVVGLGVLGASEAKSAVWFAPAGFNRGGLTEGGAGLNVIGVRHKLTSEERDRLYENNINPIASFPAEGIVVFGQKTLQVTPSALDRINVRRLLIFVKKGMSRISATTLFEQNIDTTWAAFKARSEEFLGSVKAGLGLESFKVVLDRSTTTAELVDRNVLYAKIFLKPAKSIEFIALDFVVTNAGASFED